MAKGAKYLVLVLFSFVLVFSFLLSGCTRYANEEQLTTLDETEAATVAAEKKNDELEKEKADLQAKLAEKQEELKQMEEEKEKIKTHVGE